MKYILLYHKKNKTIIMKELMDADTRPFYNAATYTLVEFDTETEMLEYIQNAGLRDNEQVEEDEVPEL